MSCELLGWSQAHGDVGQWEMSVAQGRLRDMTPAGQQGSLDFAETPLSFLANEVFLPVFVENHHLNSRQL